jgi:hypothetical protein
MNNEQLPINNEEEAQGWEVFNCSFFILHSSFFISASCPTTDTAVRVFFRSLDSRNPQERMPS